eukprot:scaffold790_cov387-Prasinococcus_capsulatus_cf.AAC.5
MAAHGYNVLWHWHPSKDTASPVTLHARRLLDENQLAERVMVSLDVAVYAEGGRVGEQVLPLTFAREQQHIRADSPQAYETNSSRDRSRALEHFVLAEATAFHLPPRQSVPLEGEAQGKSAGQSDLLHQRYKHRIPLPSSPYGLQDRYSQLRTGSSRVRARAPYQDPTKSGMCPTNSCFRERLGVCASRSKLHAGKGILLDAFMNSVYSPHADELNLCWDKLLKNVVNCRVCVRGDKYPEAESIQAANQRNDCASLPSARHAQHKRILASRKCFFYCAPLLRIQTVKDVPESPLGEAILILPLVLQAHGLPEIHNNLPAPSSSWAGKSQRQYVRSHA